MTTKRGLVFQAEIIEDDTLFFEDKFQTIPRCPRYKKKCVFTDPEGGAWTALLAPRLNVYLGPCTLMYIKVICDNQRPSEQLIWPPILSDTACNSDLSYMYM